MNEMVDIVRHFIRDRFQTEPLVAGDAKTCYTCTCFVDDYCVVAMVLGDNVEFDVLSESDIDRILSHIDDSVIEKMKNKMKKLGDSDIEKDDNDSR